MNLGTWHDRLHMHFQGLCHERATEDGLVFVLEHGLSLTEIKQLEADIRTYIQEYSPTDKHWLPWIVYAAELGYNYVGQEYWQTFVASTLGWRERGRERYWIRDKFKKFERNYRGATPSGPWAQHFSIICHPITHAILPRDFQSQLTEVLYTIRYLFTIENLQSSDLLGELIASHSLQQSKRFQQFVQDVAIVGLIAKALLNQEESHTDKILLSSTLQRIVMDLGREGVALDHLLDARRSAQFTQRRGLSSGRNSRTTFYDSRTPAQDILRIEPRLVLRRTAATSWETFLEIPDFTPLLDKHPTWRRFLEQTRVKVNGSRTILPRSMLLFGTNTIQLRTFPEKGRALLTFESDETPDELKRFLDNNFSLNTGGTILCRIASDGRAYQSRGLLVRPGRSYLVLSTVGPVRSSRFTSIVNIACEGLHANQLSVPPTIIPDYKILIERLGLTIARQISIFPVGFAAAKWDDEGHGEWLTSDEACIGIHVNHQVDGLLLELDDDKGSSLEVHPEEVGQTVFVQMPPFSRGQYQLCVYVRASANDKYEEIGQLQITIREPRLWKVAINEQGALITIVEPYKPTIEQLMRGAVAIEMHGPSGHQVQVTATFFGKYSDAALEPPQKLPNLTLPIEFNAGRAYLAQLSRKTELQAAFDFGHSCRIDFYAGVLGIFSLTCEREFTPLRWVVEKNNTSYLLSLSDDSGVSEQASVTRYDFSRPDCPNSIPYKQFFEDHVVLPTGGLYVAHGSATQCSIIFPHKLEGSVRTFADMNRTVVEPQFQSRQPSIEGLRDEIALFKLWTESRTTGSMMARLAQQRVVQDYLEHIFSIIGSSKWTASERNYRSDPYSPNAVVKLCNAVTDVPSISMSLLHQYETMKEAMPKEHAVWLASSLEAFIKQIRLIPTVNSGKQGVGLIRGGRWQAEFALRLASEPETIEYWARDWFVTGLKNLINNQPLARAARFIVLTTSHYLQNTERNQHTSLYAGWEWE